MESVSFIESAGQGNLGGKIFIISNSIIAELEIH